MDHTSLSIRNILDQTLAGQVRIPAFQRKFIWDEERVAYFMDSIYKGYPFGSLLFWRTKNPLKFDRDLGPFKLPTRDPDYPIDYVLDGQQRLTSIFSVFQTDLVMSSDSTWVDIYFDYQADPDDAQQSQFLALAKGDVDSKRHFPLNCLFDSVKYRHATEGLDKPTQKKVDKLQERFKEASIPVQILKTEDRTKVAIVFERVNRLGVELDTLQLLSAWTWSEEFDLLTRFKELKEELEEFGFAGIGDDTNLLLGCCAAVLKKDPSGESLINLSGSEVRTQFPTIINGITGAIDFLKRELHVETLKNLPYPRMLVPLSVFFAVPPGKQITLDGAKLAKIKQWFWRSSFSKRYGSQTDRTVKSDIEEMANLKDGKSSKLGDFPADIDEKFFLDNYFRIGTASTQTFILLLAQANPLSFLSGAAVDLQKGLQAYSRAEFHHIFPNAYLKTKGETDERINALANLSFLSRAENNKISKKAPSAYRADMPNNGSLDRILNRAYCPATMFNDDYDDFLKQRAGMLVIEARKYMGLPAK